MTQRFVVLCTHYPLLDRKNEEYTFKRPMHGVANNIELIETLQLATVKPGLVIHGHVHQGYKSELSLEHDYRAQPLGPGMSARSTLKVPIFNPGSSGYVSAVSFRLLSEKRAL